MDMTKKISIVEVGPRDGFQNLKDFIPTETKIKEIELLIASGVKEIEITSFVHPKAIPQMADAATVAAYFAEKYSDVKLMALVPNAKGAENALKCGIDTVAYVISASETHNMENVNRTVDQSVEELRKLRESFPEMNVRLDVATAFGCPFEGDIAKEKVFGLVDRALECGIREVVLCDTIGVANPVQVYELSKEFIERYPDVKVALHLHDTRGRGIVNAYEGMRAGISRLEASVGGLGGCPFAPGAAGNIATEDLINMLDSIGAETGINFEKYMEAVEFVEDNISSQLTGRMYKACSCKK